MTARSIDCEQKTLASQGTPAACREKTALKSPIPIDGSFVSQLSWCQDPNRIELTHYWRPGLL